MIAVDTTGFARKARALVLLFFVFVFVFVITIMASCGGSPSGGGGSTAAPTASIAANPMTITVGGSTLLTFSSTNASSGTIDNNVGPVGTNNSTGIPVTPATTTTYTFTATGPGGTATATVTVTVNPAPPPPTVTLSSNASGVMPGQEITLSWTSSNATSVVINSTVGPSPGGVTPVASGSVDVTPTATTSYTAVATGSGIQVSSAAVPVNVGTITSFTGLDSTVPGGSSEDDIDPNGAVGLTQFMEYVNTSFQAYDKATFTPLLPVGGTPTPVSIGSVWPANTNCGSTGIQLDVQIIYDQFAQRWVIMGKSTRGTANSGDYYLCVAVSNMDDVTNPAFRWYAYSFDLVSFLGDHNGLPYYPDWPKISTWPTSADGNSSYIVTMDMEDETSQEELGVAVCALNRNNLLSGNNGVTTLAIPGTVQCFKDTGALLATSGGLYLGHSLMPPDVDGNGTTTQAPPSGRDAYLTSIYNPKNPFSTTVVTTNSSNINLWDLHIDWTPGHSSNSTFSLVSSPSVTTYTPGCYTQDQPAQTICVPEPGQSELGGGIKVDSVGDRFMPRMSYRNFGSYESFLVSQTVQIGPGLNNCGQSCQTAQQTGILWYELRGNGSGAPAVAQEGTISYGDTFFRFLPSIAQDKNGYAAVGYSISNPLQNPGISFSYWNLNPVNHGQPTEVGILTSAGEEIPFNPSSGVIGNNGQWGSYASISVDPSDDCTFWYVNEYWPTTVLTGEPASWSTNVAKFQLPDCFGQ